MDGISKIMSEKKRNGHESERKLAQLLTGKEMNGDTYGKTDLFLQIKDIYPQYQEGFKYLGVSDKVNIQATSGLRKQAGDISINQIQNYYNGELKNKIIDYVNGRILYHKDKSNITICKNNTFYLLEQIKKDPIGFLRPILMGNGSNYPNILAIKNDNNQEKHLVRCLRKVLSVADNKYYFFNYEEILSLLSNETEFYVSTRSGTRICGRLLYGKILNKEKKYQLIQIETRNDETQSDQFHMYIKLPTLLRTLIIKDIKKMIEGE